jgi:hypothetical protein
MESFHTQMSNALNNPSNFPTQSTIFPTDEWTLKNYREFFEYVKQGYVIQSDEWGNNFTINPEWEGDDLYEEEEICIRNISKLSNNMNKEFDGDALDRILHPDGLDWTFDKPESGKWYTIYIVEKENEEEEVATGLWTEDKEEVWDDRNVKCWQCSDCNGWEDWGVNCGCRKGYRTQETKEPKLRFKIKKKARLD